MKDRRERGEFKPRKAFFFFTLLLVFFSGFTFSSLRLFFTEGYHPQLVSPWRTTATEAISADSPATPALSVRDTVIFPDQAVLFLKYPPSAPFLTKDDTDCIYFSSNSSRSPLKLSPVSIDGEYQGHQIVRCPLQPRGFTVSVAVKSNGNLPAGPTHHRDAFWLTKPRSTATPPPLCSLKGLIYGQEGCQMHPDSSACTAGISAGPNSC